ncbi:MAG TPA: mechanosensitive ion channel [Candidatus Brocadiia bacterium]|nr:mechanosensitive ion channel [Candidatus Brocadiia bacterium]
MTAFTPVLADMQTVWESFSQGVGKTLSDVLSLGVDILWALAILVGGWILARVLQKGLTRGLAKTKADEWLSEKTGRQFRFSEIVGQVFFGLVMLFVFGLMLNALKFTEIAEPINLLLTSVAMYVPRLVAGGAILIVAYIIGRVAQVLAAGIIASSGVDKYFQKEDSTEGFSLSRTTGTIVFSLVMLVSLPLVLEALNLQDMAEPFQKLASQILNEFLPKLALAGIIIVVGWWLAKLARSLLLDILKATRIDNLAAKLGLGASPSLSEVLSSIAFVVALLMVAMEAMEKLGLEAMHQQVRTLVNSVLEFLPDLASALIVMALAIIGGRLLQTVVSRMLENATRKVSPYLGEIAEGLDLAAICGKVVMIMVVLFGAVQASELLGLEEIRKTMEGATTIALKVISAMAIMIFAVLISSFARNLVSKSSPDMPYLGGLVRGAILALGISMALSQLEMAQTVVHAAFILLLGSVSVAVALAFGLGGRNVAEKELDRLVTKAHEPHEKKQMEEAKKAEG